MKESNNNDETNENENDFFHSNSSILEFKPNFDSLFESLLKFIYTGDLLEEKAESLLYLIIFGEIFKVSDLKQR